MPSKTLPTTVARYLILIPLVFSMAGMVSAQTGSNADKKYPIELAQPGSETLVADKAAPSQSPAVVQADQNADEANVGTPVSSNTVKEQPPTPTQTPLPAPPCNRNISADVVALPQPIMLNRLGASVPDGLVFALKSDTLGSGSSARLRDEKRPRPLVLRANVGDCLTINFTNSIPKTKFENAKTPTFTTEVSLHVQGMQWLTGSKDDGSFVGLNDSSLASAPPGPGPTTQTYKLYAKEEGSFLLYTTGDSSSEGLQLQRGLFGALNVQPKDAEWYRSQVTRQDLLMATKNTSIDGKHPVVNYKAVYPLGNPRGGVPILNMLNSNNQIVHSDLTAIITGKDAGRFAGTTGPDKPEPPCNAEGLLGTPKGDPLFCANPASPDRKQPYREVTIIYHEAMDAVTAQAFPIFTNAFMKNTLAAGKDAFAINYGTGGISAEIYANRIGVGPMGSCVDCKFEEFFLSAWSVGDPAMLVDVPANSNLSPPLTTSPATPPFPKGTPPAPVLCTAEQLGDKASTPSTSTCVNKRVSTPDGGYTLAGLNKATRAYYPDDPSNVYHSYINDHLKFRILHGGTGVSHVHHQHAHQWLQSPNSDEGAYLDSQMISPGASYTLEMTYNGSGNRNKVVGDSIFHCHFYPHFASGMWAMWRTHDVFENGTELNGGIPISGARALPDGEIQAGTPIPALVPLPTIPMAPLAGNGLDNSKVFIDKGQVVYGTPATPDPEGKNVTENPGFPFFIPGVAGARAPHPPLDFARDTISGDSMDGGLPRHVITGGEISYEAHTNFDWSKDLAKVDAIKLPEDGTHVEKVAMQYFSRRCQPTVFPDGSASTCPSSNDTIPHSTLINPPTGFVLNGLPLGPQSGAPFADPAIDDNGNPINYNPVTKIQEKRVYKAAAIQMDVKLNKPALGWHYSQQRMLTLWNDANDTLSGKRPPEPLFFRGNSGDIIEYWHTNLVPNYYLVDDFQVRTPTDILGQHIHLVKFDVTSSDGAGNGFNYEDGTFSPQEVQETIHAINAAGGITTIAPDGTKTQTKLEPTPPPKEILDCQLNPTDPRCLTCEEWLKKQPNPVISSTNRPQCPSWWGAQTTIQRWYLDPLVDNSNVDRTLRTVFTHDHFGPSTHQQAGLYAGLLVEPMGSSWRNSETGAIMGRPTSSPPVRPDGGPTSWKADILTKNLDGDNLSYREFALEFQDFQLAYQSKKQGNVSPKPNLPNSNPSKGYRDPAFAIGAPSTPSIISTGTVGTHSVNYKNEPIPYRVGKGDLSEAFNSAIIQPASLVGMQGDPATPLMRAYQGDNVQIRLLVGAHMFAHQFNLHGPTWYAEPSWSNSGFRSAQAMGLSEHFELLFQVPSSSAPKPATSGVAVRKCPDGMSDGNCADYLYSPSFDIYGISNGMWGLFRAYDSNKTAKRLTPLPNNPIGPSTNVEYSTCPGEVNRTIRVTAVTAQKALALRSKIPNTTKGQIVFNDRADPKEVLSNPLGIMYVMTDDLDAQGRLKDGVPIEPLILRANAGDCIEVQLTNDLDPYTSDIFKTTLKYAEPLGGRSMQDIINKTTPPKSLSNVLQVAPSTSVGLHPQLLSYDAVTSTGINVGYNSKNQASQVAAYGKTVKYRWYAGKVERKADGKLDHIPVEFGSLNLFPSDPMFQHFNGLFGSMVIEPADATWQCGEASGLGDCDPPARADGQAAVAYTPPSSRASATVKAAGSSFREFVAMISDDINISPTISYGAMQPNGKRAKKSTGNSAAVNYRTEPWSLRYAFNATRNFSCMTSNQLIGGTINALPNGDPVTPIFTAQPGDAVRFRMTHPYGLGTSQVFTVHGHVWQRNPYANKSREIGDNRLSQWLGSRDNHGSTDHFDLTIDKAGGESLRTGDHLYSVFLPGQAKLGPWGIFRVGNPSAPTVKNPACTVIPPSTGRPYEPPKQTDRDMLIRKPINDPAPSRP